MWDARPASQQGIDSLYSKYGQNPIAEKSQAIVEKLHLLFDEWVWFAHKIAFLITRLFQQMFSIISFITEVSLSDI